MIMNINENIHRQKHNNNPSSDPTSNQTVKISDEVAKTQAITIIMF